MTVCDRAVGLWPLGARFENIHTPCCLAAVLSLAMRVCLRRRVAPTTSQGRGHKYDARGEAELAYGGNLGENRPVTSGSLFTISSDNGSTCEYIVAVKHGRPRKYKSVGVVQWGKCPI